MTVSSPNDSRNWRTSGIVERRVYDSKPVVVEYSLTEKGAAFRQVVEAIQRWADQWEAQSVGRNHAPESTRQGLPESH